MNNFYEVVGRGSCTQLQVGVLFFYRWHSHVLLPTRNSFFSQNFLIRIINFDPLTQIPPPLSKLNRIFMKSSIRACVGPFIWVKSLKFRADPLS